MKVSDLITLLTALPKEATVVLCDSNRMAYEATDEPSGEGLYYDFDLYFDTESFFKYEDEYQENPIPTVVFSFETDYEEMVKEFNQLDEEIKKLESNSK